MRAPRPVLGPEELREGRVAGGLGLVAGLPVVRGLPALGADLGYFKWYRYHRILL